MSATPRTDAAELVASDKGFPGYVHVSIAKKLETELAAAREKLDLYEQALVDLRDDAAVIANDAPEEKERSVGRKMILRCETAFARRAALDAAKEKT